MKLKCTVEVHDHEVCKSSDVQRVVLSLEKKVKSYKTEAYLVCKIEGKNEVTKYLISKKDLYHSTNNVKGVCLHYKNSKEKHLFDDVTIYFESPPHSLEIRSRDNDSLKKFTNLVCLMAVGRWFSVHQHSWEKPNFKLRNTKVVGKKTKYPPKKGFPRTTKELVLRKMDITNFDPQIIFGLHNLRVLNLSNNRISFLPKEFGTLSLEKLTLSHNCLGSTFSLEFTKFEWMKQTVISQSLKELNISNNELTEFPLQIGKLQNLIFIDVSHNLLTNVPQIIGALQHLAQLDLSTNLLLYLPGSMRGMTLDYLDISNNPFGHVRSDNRYEEVPSLYDLAAKAVKKYKIPYKKLVPRIVRKYLDNDKLCCVCRTPCFHSNIKMFIPLLDSDNHLPLSGVCQSSKIVPGKQVLFECYFCSPQCSAYYPQVDND